MKPQNQSDPEKLTVSNPFISSKVLFICFAAIAVSIACCRNCDSYEVSLTGQGAEIKWSTPNISYFVNPSGGPSNSLSQIRAAAQTWTDVMSSAFTFSYSGTTASTSYGVNDGINTITFGFLEGEALAQNTFWYRTASGEILDSDIRFNTEYSWNTNGSSSGYDVQNACTHEMGHSLSLEDLYAQGDREKTMYGYISAGETKKRTLDPDDAAGISYLYPGTEVEYFLTLHVVGQGTVTVNPDGSVFSAGATVDLTAIAEPGWIFSSWSGDLIGSKNPETLAMNDDKDITAAFEPAPNYTLRIETVGEGEVRRVPDGPVYEAGTLVELTAEPVADVGNRGVFVGWGGDWRGSENPTTIAVDADKNISATFLEVAAVQGGLLNVGYVDPGRVDNTQDKPENFPYGLLEMDIETNRAGETAVVIIYLPKAAPSDQRWYKYTSSGSWLDFAREIVSGGSGDGAVFNADRTEVTLYITDNGPFDDDPTDGIIRDPSGLGFDSPNTTRRSSSSGGGGGGCFIAATGQRQSK